MVLFYCDHLGTLPQAIALRAHRHPEEEAILVVRETNFTKSSFAHRLIQNNVFSKILTSSGGRISFYLTSIAEQERVILQHFDEILITNEININTVSTCYTLCDVDNVFGVYLSLKKKPFIMVEMLKDQFLNTSRYTINSNAFNTHPSYQEIQQMYDTLCGANNPLIKKRFLFAESESIVGARDDKDEYLHFDSLLSTIPESFQQKIISCLDANYYSLSEPDTCLVLPNSTPFVSYWTDLPEGKGNLLYQLLLDYYHVDITRPIVNEHPMSVGQSVARDLENSTQLEPYIPIDFYGFLRTTKVANALTIGSLSLEKLKTNINSGSSLGEQFARNYRLTHKVFTAYAIAEMINSNGTQFHIAGINKEYIGKFVRYAFERYSMFDPMGINWRILAGDIYTVIGDVPYDKRDDLRVALENANQQTKVVFLNSDNSYPFYFIENKQLLEYVVPIAISKTAVNDRCLTDIETETIFFFCKDKAICDKVRAWSLVKNLRQTKLVVHASSLELEAMLPMIDEVVGMFTQQQILIKTNELLLNQIGYFDRIGKILKSFAGFIRRLK